MDIRCGEFPSNEAAEGNDFRRVVVTGKSEKSVKRGTGKKGKAAFRQAFGQVKDFLDLTAAADKDMRQRLCKLQRSQRSPHKPQQRKHQIYSSRIRRKP